MQSISIAKLQYSGQTNENLAVLGEVETLVRPQKQTNHWRILDCSKIANCEDLSFPIQFAIFIWGSELTIFERTQINVVDKIFHDKSSIIASVYPFL